jgi:hypothetical protein
MTEIERAQREIALEQERFQLRMKLLDDVVGSPYRMTDELKAKYEARLAAVQGELVELGQS